MLSKIYKPLFQHLYRNNNIHWALKTYKYLPYLTRNTSSISLRGIFPPIVTPFNRDEIAYDSLKNNVHKMERIPFSGYVLFGSTGEAVSLSVNERINIMKFIKDLMSEKKLLIAGSGMESTKLTIEFIKEMAQIGADAALIIPPSFYKSSMTDDALHKHYIKIANVSPIPVILYNMPANTGIDLTASLIVKLADHPNIIGLKDSGGDITKINWVIHLTKEKNFQVVAGSAGFLYAAYSVGCVGGVLALANSLGKELCELHQLFSEGRHTEALHLQGRLIGPNIAVTKRFGIAGVKKSMDFCGYDGGQTRAPLLPLTESQEKELKQEFQSNGFI